MPIISQFYGILIYIYKEISGQHNTPNLKAFMTLKEIFLPVNCQRSKIHLLKFGVCFIPMNSTRLG